MRPLSVFLFFALLAGAGCCLAAAETANSALDAIKKLPRGEAKKIARIEAREGAPVPERWHILVNDPKDENGLHEYVVAGGEIVASRNISQFAESLKPTDVMSLSALRIDSDKVADLAQQYAAANSLAVASFNYALKKEADETLEWDVTCVDAAGNNLGHLVVDARKGNVISHDGFAVEPAGGAGIDAQSPESGEENRHHSSRRSTTVRNKATPQPDKKDILSKIGKWFSGH